jgi:hypothetical protein
MLQHVQARMAKVDGPRDQQSNERRNLGANQPRQREQVLHVLCFEFAAKPNEIVSETEHG